MEQKHLMEMEEADQVRIWLGRIELAKRYQKEYGDTDGRWGKNVKAMAGDFNSRAELGDEAIDVNLVRSTIDTALPPLWLAEPRLSVAPTVPTFKGEDNIRRAELCEAELNYWLAELDVRRQVRKVLHDAEATNQGFLYVGYTKDKRDIESDGVVLENQPTVRHRQPFVRRISPKMVLMPPGYDEIEACPWVDIVFLRRLDHVKKRFGARAKDVQGTSSYSTKTPQDTRHFSDYLDSEDVKMVEVHNVWCKETKKVYVLAGGHDDFLEDPKAWPWEVEGFPLEHYRPKDVPDELYGTPPISFYLPQNKELNAARTAMRKRFNRTKAVIFADSQTAQELKEAYAKAQDGEVLPAGESDVPMSNKLMVFEGVQISGQDIVYGNVVKGDVIEQAGLSAEQRGAGDPNIGSATASANIQRSAEIRQSERADAVRRMYLGVCRKLWMILKQFPNEKRTRMIAGPMAGQMRTLRYSLEEIRGEFEFDMDYSAMVADTPSNRSTQAVLNYNLMRADPLVNPERLLLDIFRAQNKKDPEGYLIFLRPPAQELQMMIQGLPVEPHERDDHLAHLKQHYIDWGKLDAAIDKFAPNTPQNTSIRFASALMAAHVNATVKMVKQIQGPGQGREAGSPVAENMLRNQVRAGSGETAAELTGQPLDSGNLVS